MKREKEEGNRDKNGDQADRKEENKSSKQVQLGSYSHYDYVRCK